MRQIIASVAALLLIGLSSKAIAQSCAGDCNGDGSVRIGELIQGVNIALGRASADECTAIDSNADGQVGIGELIQAVRSALDGCPGTPTPTLSPTPTAAPPLVEIEVGTAPVEPGEPLDIAIQVSNPSHLSIFGAELTMRMPNNVRNLQQRLITGGGRCNGDCEAGENIVWDLGEIPPGRGQKVSMRLATRDTILEGDLVSLAVILSSSNTPQVAEEREVSVVSEKNLHLAIDASRSSIEAGADLTYTITYGNSGAGPSQGTLVEMPVPEGTTFVEASGDASIDESTVTWQLGSLGPGEGGVVSLVVTVDSQLVGGAQLVARASVVDEGGGSHATTVSRVGEQSPLSLAIEVSPNSLKSGSVVAVNLYLTNTSSNDLFNIVAGLRLPQSISGLFTDGRYFKPTADQFTCRAGGGNCGPGDLPKWSIGSIPAGESFLISLTTGIRSDRLSPESGMLVPFRANAAAEGATQHQVNQSYTSLVDEANALALRLNEDSDPVAAGNEIRYSLTYSNSGTGPALGATLQMPLPEGTSFVQASDDGVLVGSATTWTLGTIAPGDGGEVSLVVAVDTQAASGKQILSQATFAGSGSEARATAVTRVAEPPPLSLSLDVTPNPVMPGEILAVTMRVTNSSSNTINDAQVDLRVPAFVRTFHETEASPRADNCPSNTCMSHDRPVWTVGSLAPGEFSVISLTPQVRRQSSPDDGTLLTFATSATTESGPEATVAKTLVTIGQ